MPIDKTSNLANTKEKAWEYLPDILDKIKLYLRNGDLIELSKVCKNYRVQLNPIVFNSLTIFRRQQSVLDKYNPLSSRKHKFYMILNDMKKDLKSCIHLVKHLRISISIPIYFITELMKLFPDINRLSIFGGGKESLKGLISILQELKNLNQAKLPIVFNQIKESDIPLYLPFLRKFKVLELDCIWSYHSIKPYSLLLFDSTFTNIKTLNISNLDILNNFPKNLPNLIEVKLTKYSSRKFTISNLCDFLNNNRNLKKLTISSYNLFSEVVKIILNYKKLEYLEIINWQNSGKLEGLKFNNNYSIKSVKLYYDLVSEYFDLILNYCKNLKIIEVEELRYQYDFNTDLINNNNRPVELLILKSSTSFKQPYLPQCILKYFKRVKLINWCDRDKFNEKIINNYEGWKLYENDNCKIREYFIIKD